MSERSGVSARAAAELTVNVNGHLEATPQEAVVPPNSRIRWFNESDQPIFLRFKVDACPLLHIHGPEGCRIEIPPNHYGGSASADQPYGNLQDRPGTFDYDIMIAKGDPSAGTPKIIIQ
jgi:hypothetical protein